MRARQIRMLNEWGVSAVARALLRVAVVSFWGVSYSSNDRQPSRWELFGPGSYLSWADTSRWIPEGSRQGYSFFFLFPMFDFPMLFAGKNACICTCLASRVMRWKFSLTRLTTVSFSRSAQASRTSCFCDARSRVCVFSVNTAPPMNSNLHIPGWSLHADFGMVLRLKRRKRDAISVAASVTCAWPLGTADVPRLITKLAKGVEQAPNG